MTSVALIDEGQSNAIPFKQLGQFALLYSRPCMAVASLGLCILPNTKLELQSLFKDAQRLGCSDSTEKFIPPVAVS